MIELPGNIRLGTVVSLDHQSFEFVETVPHIRQDGQQTTLLAWETACAACGEQFRALSPATRTLNGLSRRCQACKRPGKPVKGKRGRKVRVVVIEP